MSKILVSLSGLLLRVSVTYYLQKTGVLAMTSVNGDPEVLSVSQRKRVVDHCHEGYIVMSFIQC